MYIGMLMVSPPLNHTIVRPFCIAIGTQIPERKQWFCTVHPITYLNPY